MESSQVPSVGWWGNFHKDCEAWVSRCRAVKRHTLGSSTWRSERYTAQSRVIQVDLITDLTPASDDKVHILSAIDMFTLWIWLVAIPDKSAITVATALLHGVCLDLAGFPSS